MHSDLAYLLGAGGDATAIYYKPKNEYYIEYEQKSKEWLENSILPRVERVFGKKTASKQRKSGMYRVRFYSKDAFFLFLEIRKNPLKILRWSKEAQVNFVKGFFDAEGSVQCKPRMRIQIYQKSKAVLHVISKILTAVGIKCGNITTSRDVFILPIRSKTNLIKFSRFIGSEDPQKLKVFADLKYR